MSLETEGTILVLTGIGIPLYSARGLTQTLDPIDEATQLRRTINGTLVDLSRTEARKYRSSISCSGGLVVPAFDQVWPGKQVVVDCIVELAYLTSVGAPGRTIVPDSSRTQGSYTFYRPRLTMLVVVNTANDAEWSQEIGWQLDLEEV